MDAALAKKLKMQGGQRIFILNAPEDYLERITPFPEPTEVDVKPEGKYDVVHLFVRSIAELEQHAKVAIAAVKPDTFFWISYPKKSSKLKTDLNRDCGWEPLTSAGYEGIALISVDDTWSAMRFRPSEQVNSSSPRRDPAARAAGARGKEFQDRTIEVPVDLQQLLRDNPEAQAFFDGLSYTYRKEYVRWITDAKREETRNNRLEKTIEKLAAGIKSPTMKS